MRAVAQCLHTATRWLSLLYFKGGSVCYSSYSLESALVGGLHWPRHVVFHFLHYEGVGGGTPSITMHAWGEARANEVSFYQLKLPLPIPCRNRNVLWHTR